MTFSGAIEPHSDRTTAALQRLRAKLDELARTDVDMLPPERALATEFGVSRRVIRQALDILEAERKVVRTQGRGTMILREDEPPPDGHHDIKKYTSPVDIMEARLALEPAVAALAARHASSRDLEDIRRYIERGRQATDHRVWDEWDGSLHKTIGRSTNNALLVRFCNMLDEARAQTAWGHLRKASLNAKRQALYTRQHEAILTAITDRNPEQAAKAMKQHLLTVKRTLIDQIDDYDVMVPEDN